MQTRDGNVPKATGGWTCPDCGRNFAKRGQKHVCEVWTVDHHLGDKPDHVIDLFHRLSEAIGRCGPFEYAPVRVQVGFRVQRIFAGVALKKTGLHGYLDLAKRVESERFQKIMPYTKRLWVHRFAITSAEQLDDEFQGWLLDSYHVGEGRHLES